jgi:hypothetical protein
MKPIKIISIKLTLLFLAITTACEKMIEVDIPENQMSSGLVFENVQTADAALAALYAGLRDQSPIAGDKAGVLLGIYADDVDSYATTATNGVYDIYRNQQIASNPIIYSYWSEAYQQVYLANAIIEGVRQSSSLSSADKDRIKGEVLFVRSVLFFYLWQMFGDIPYPLTTNYQVNLSLSKTNSADVLTKLEADLNESLTLLKDEYRNVERIYPNRKVAQLLLAKVLMVQQRWTEAEVVLKSIVQNPQYQFQQDITKVFLKSGSHILWQLKPKNPGDPTREAQTYYFTGAAPSTYAISQNLISTFSVGDLRKQNWTAPVNVGTNTWFRADKYKNRINNATEYSVIFRLEEVYLLLAEALTQQNKIQEALPYINATRQRAGLQVLSSSITKDQLLDEILLENRKEFFTEMGHRFMDLKRFDRQNDLLLAKPNWKPYHRLWPVPQQELLLNPHLNPQNTGY